MLISEDSSMGLYQIKAYTEHSITINDTIYTHSLIVSNQELITNWRPIQLNDLNEHDFEPLSQNKLQLILLGTGTQFKMLSQHLLQALESKLTIETMSTPAACRTFNALSSEGRNVAAALIIENL